MARQPLVAAELLIVSVVMWYITDTLYCELSTYMEPRGFDTGHCYKIDMGELTAKSPDYRPYTTQEERAADVREFVERLRRRPEVEAVSLSVNAYPYNGSSSGANVSLDTLHVHGYCIRRFVTPDFMRVFRYRGTRGETPEQLSGILERGEFLASDNLYQRNYGLTMTSLVGREFHLMDDTTETCRLGAALVPVRYHDYYPAWASYSMVYNLNTLSIDFITSGCELCLRVKAGEDRDFIARLKADSESQFRIGNIYMADAVSFTELRRSFLQSRTNNMRYFLTGMGFLLFNIFLGLFGTFWFRTRPTPPGDSPAQSPRCHGQCGLPPPPLRRSAAPGTGHPACLARGLPPGRCRAERLAERHHVGVGQAPGLCRLHLPADSPHDSHRHRHTRPPCHAGAACRGTARRVAPATHCGKTTQLPLSSMHIPA